MKSGYKRILLVIGILLLTFVISGVACYCILIMIGKNKITKETKSYIPTFVTQETLEASIVEKENWQEGWVKFEDKIYEYNDDLITFLIMGIDKEGKAIEVAQGTNGGQADALFLLVIDSNTKVVKVVSINRNSMTDIDVYNENGDYVSTVRAQIAVQHGFGDGVEKSCEYQTSAVSKMLYNMPIQGYCAINMKAIEILNDAVGGVELVALSDVYNDKNQKIIGKGEAISLTGKQAYWYVRDRNTSEFASADLRLERQKQYLALLLNKVKSKVVGEISQFSAIYDSLQPYMTTNISFDETLLLMPVMASNSFGSDSIYSLEGNTVQGDKFEEFIIDEEALYKTIIDIFYREVEVK